jgi:hypothetical protein
MMFVSSNKATGEESNLEGVTSSEIEEINNNKDLWYNFEDYIIKQKQSTLFEINYSMQKGTFMY